MLCGIREFIFIINKGQERNFRNSLGNINDLGIKIKYVTQSSPRGLPDAFLITKELIKNNSIAMILGDNFFYGQNLSKLLHNCAKLKKGAKIILHSVQNPELFGVAKINNKNKKILKIIEKPKKFVSNHAITGLYFFDKKVVEYAKKLKPSSRNELEITDLLKVYLKKKKLTSDILGRGGAWLDTGSLEDFYKTSAFVSAIENRQGFKIACLEEIAFNNRWINKKEIFDAIQFYGKCDYSNYLKRLVS
jgi:glucose-1-phosphate thymidylyltransferase